MTANTTKSRGNLIADLIAGLTTGVANVPDALASAVLAGANPVQRPIPSELPGNAVTLLQIFGNMTFAGAETLETKLPPVKDAERPVVILRLRAQEGICSSFLEVLTRYSRQLETHGGKLMLAGVRSKVKGQLDRTETTSEILGAENVFVATTTLGASTRAAYEAAQRWLQAPPAEPKEVDQETH
jgi:sulfate permease, SulP family